MKPRFTFPKQILLPLFTAILLGLSFSSRATIREIESYNYYFLGDTTRAFVGDTIRFVNKEGAHWPTSTSIPSSALPFSKVLPNAGDTLLYVVTIGGEYDFICNYHSEMAGVILVSLPTNINTPTALENDRIPKLYPLPFRNKLTIDINRSSLFKYTVTVEVANSLGQREYSTVTNDIATPLNLDLAELLPGIHFVTLSEGNTKRTYRVVKGE